MGTESVLIAIDEEISKLQKARALLAGSKVNSSVVAKQNSKPRKKRNLTEEGRRRIAEAVKRRWAKQKAAVRK